MPRKRTNVFSRHPDGVKLLEDLKNKRRTQIEVAKILGCSPGNISLYLKNHHLRLTRTEKRDTDPLPPSELARGKLDEMDQITLSVDGKTPLELVGAVGWRAVLQGLLMLSERELEPDQFVKVSNTLLRMFEYQFRNRIPEVPEKPIVLVREDEDRVFQRLGDFCEYCQFRRTFLEAKAREQDKHRLAPEQSARLG